jgi:hypothetical protein
VNLQNQLLHEQRLHEIRRELQREALRIEALDHKRRNSLTRVILNKVGDQLINLGTRLQVNENRDQLATKHV